MVGAIKDIKIYFKENFFLEKFKKDSRSIRKCDVQS